MRRLAFLSLFTLCVFGLTLGKSLPAPPEPLPPEPPAREQVRAKKKSEAENCPYCHDSFLEAEYILKCDSCDTPMHAECLSANNGRCTTLGCQGSQCDAEDLRRRRARVTLLPENMHEAAWRAFAAEVQKSWSLSQIRLLGEEAIPRLIQLIEAHGNVERILSPEKYPQSRWTVDELKWTKNAIDQLARTRSPEALNYLGQYIRKPSITEGRDLIWKILPSFKHFGTTNGTRVLVEALQAKETGHNVRKSILEFLGELGSDARFASPILYDRMQELVNYSGRKISFHLDWSFFELEGQALSKIGFDSPEMTDGLMEMYKNKTDPYLRTALVTALGGALDPQSGSQNREKAASFLSRLVLPAFKDSDVVPEVAEAAARSLGRLGIPSESVFEALATGLTFPNLRKFYHACIWAIGELGESSKNTKHNFENKFLWKLVYSDLDSFRSQYLIEALGKMKSNKADLAIQEILSRSNDHETKLIAVRALGRIGSHDPRVVSELISASYSSNTEIVVAAIKALEGIVDTHQEDIKRTHLNAAVDRLVHLHSDRRYPVRKAAKEAIKTLSSIVVPVLIKRLRPKKLLLKSKENILKSRAEKRNAKKILDELLRERFIPLLSSSAALKTSKLLKDKDPEVRKMASEFLSGTLFRFKQDHDGFSLLRIYLENPSRGNWRRFHNTLIDLVHHDSLIQRCLRTHIW